MKHNLQTVAISLTVTLFACNSSSDHSDQKNTADSLSTSGNTAAQTFTLDTTTLANGTSYYQCEMDPEVISDKPGNCTKCGMDLTEIRKQ